MEIKKSLLQEYHILPYEADLMVRQKDTSWALADILIPEFVMPTVINRCRVI